MKRTSFAFFLAVLLWFCGGAASHAQDVLSASHLRAAAAPPPALLTGQGGQVPLDDRTRFWIDPGGQQTIEQVAAAGDALGWSLRERGATFNLDGKALWLQFDAVNDGRQRWYLELPSSGLDRVELFWQEPSGHWVRQEAGDSRAVSAWPLPGRFPTFELAARGAEPVRYWVRVEHHRVDFATSLSAHSQGVLLASREREQFLLGAYFGLAALIVVVSVANAVVYRDKAFGAYAVYVSLLALGQAAYLGVGAQHLWNDHLKWNETATFVLPGISSAVALWFAKVVTEPARFSRALDLAVWSLIAALLSAVALDTFLNERISFALVMALTLVALVVVMGLIALVWTQGDDPHIRMIAVGFLPVLVMALFPVARGLNLIPASPLTRYGLSIGAALEMPILFYALMLRGGRRRESQVRTAALLRNDPLTGLAHSRTLSQRLDNALLRARSLKHSCVLMAVKIANFQAIADEFGREAIDRTLVVAASQLRQAITDIDLAARTGERDFAVLLEGPTHRDNAMSRAQQLIAAGLRQADALPPGLTIRYHIALAILPDGDRTLDANAAMRWLQEGVDSMPADVRKQIRPLNF